MKRAILLAAALCLGAATAFDAYQQYGLDRKEAEARFVDWVASSGGGFPPVPASLRALAAEGRGPAAKALCGALKAYYGSEAFRASYAGRTAVAVPPKPVPARSAAEIKAEKDAELARSLADMEKTIAAMPRAQQAEMRQTVESTRKMMAESLGNMEPYVEAERKRFQQEQQDYEEALAKAKAADPAKESKEHLRAALQRFLQETEGIDYAAGLVTQGGLRRFSNPVYEAKPDVWKKGFRAGREATEPTRAFARAWLAELQ